MQWVICVWPLGGKNRYKLWTRHLEGGGTNVSANSCWFTHPVDTEQHHRSFRVTSLVNWWMQVQFSHWFSSVLVPHQHLGEISGSWAAKCSTMFTSMVTHCVRLLFRGFLFYITVVGLTNEQAEGSGRFRWWFSVWPLSHCHTVFTSDTKIGFRFFKVVCKENIKYCLYPAGLLLLSLSSHYNLNISWVLDC